MNFDVDVFVSYAHLDDTALGDDRKGWVSKLHETLDRRLAQLLGKPPRIWRDPKLHGNDVFADALVERLQQRRRARVGRLSALREVGMDHARSDRVLQGRRGAGGVQIHDKSRIFKVLKTPVPLDQQRPPLPSLLGYEFFVRRSRHREGPRVRRAVRRPSASAEFLMKLDDLAHGPEVAARVRREPRRWRPGADDSGCGHDLPGRVTTLDLQDQRDAIRRDLQQHGYTVLPAQPLPTVGAEVEAAVREDLARCSLSIHLVGKHYSLMPEGAMASLVEMQNELAIERGRTRRVRAPRVDSAGAAGRRPAAAAMSSSRLRAGSPRRGGLRSPRDAARRSPHGDSRDAGTWPTRRQPRGGRRPGRRHHAAALRVLHLRPARRRRGRAVGRLAVRQGLEVIPPVFDGDESEIREYHEENLRSVRRRRDLLRRGQRTLAAAQAPRAAEECGLRTHQAGAGGRPSACCAPKTPEKERFRTHEGTRRSAMGRSVAQSRWLPIIARLKAMTAFNPFPGLRPFEADEDHLFFGREKEIDELLRRLRSTRFLSVVGTSGSGKSSLVRSGLIPSLHSGVHGHGGVELAHRDAAARRGSDRPPRRGARSVRASLAAATARLADTSRVVARGDAAARLARASSTPCATRESPPRDNVLVVVDQFEELFRFRRSRQIDNSRDEAIAFVKLLLEATKQSALPIYVVLTMRSDFIGDCMRVSRPAGSGERRPVPRAAHDPRRGAGWRSPGRWRSAAARSRRDSFDAC